MTQAGRSGLLPVPDGRSGCPINMTVELLGDRWTFIVLRDLVFSSHSHYRELLGHSLEGIASNILADRLARLTAAGLLTREPDPSHKQKIAYCLTEPAIQLVPILAQLGSWGAHWLPTTPELRVRAELLAAGGPQLWERLMDELRAVHLGKALPPPDGVLAQLTEAYEAMRADRQEG